MVSRSAFVLIAGLFASAGCGGKVLAQAEPVDGTGGSKGIGGSYGVGGSYYGAGGSYGIGGSYYGAGGSYYGAGGSYYGAGGSYYGAGGSYYGAGGSYGVGGAVICGPQFCPCGDGFAGVGCAVDAGALCVCHGNDEFQILRWFQLAIVGDWTGTMTSPWTSPAPVDFHFYADGHYAAHALAPGQGPALYYGVDADSPEKTYRLYDVTASQEATGTIAVYFSPGDTVQDEMRYVSLDANIRNLTFEVWHLGQYGPISYKLTRD